MRTLIACLDVGVREWSRGRRRVGFNEEMCGCNSCKSINPRDKESRLGTLPNNHKVKWSLI